MCTINTVRFSFVYANYLRFITVVKKKYTINKNKSLTKGKKYLDKKKNFFVPSNTRCS